jgi:hypothetical protein
MSHPLQSTLRFGLIVATLLLAGVGSAYVLDLVAADLARGLAVKSVLLSAISTAAFAVATVASGPRAAAAPLTDGRR